MAGGRVAMNGGGPNRYPDEDGEAAAARASHGGPERRCVIGSRCVIGKGRITGTSRVTRTGDTATPGAATRSPDGEEPAESGGGLREFGLGMIPASITPPRTWRRAAWFVVISAAAALGGIALITAVVMSNEPARLATVPRELPRAGEYPPLSRTDESTTDSGDATAADDNALPEPSSSELTRQPAVTGRTAGDVPPAHYTPSGTRQRSSTAVPSTSRQSTAPTHDLPTAGTAVHHLAAESTPQQTTPSNEPPTSGTPASTAFPGTLQQNATPWHTTAPTATKRPTPQSPAQQGTTQQGTTQQETTSPPTAMLDLTKRYFGALDSGKPCPAHELTAGSLRHICPHRHYAELGSIELVHSTVRGNGTVNELRVESGFGGPSTRYRRLEFDAHLRRVVADEPVDDPPGNR
ncbi:hypothetical protein ACOQFL_02925 [Actinopolyspora sp. H202]|uniref:hypothetical protein n=1 Tax=Actinopolyspora sp. H202 TaxID=1500456 RepID=UPI003EE741A7